MAKIIVGLMGSSVASGAAKLSTAQQVTSFLDVCASHGIREVDTARVYAEGRSEELLGEISACKLFQVATKAPGFGAGTHRYEKVLEAGTASLKALKTDTVDLFYIHGPDHSEPLDGMCRAMNDLYKRGAFTRFGVSNLTADEVERVHEICTTNNYVLPSVYQGLYNPLSRGAETALFPTLRRLRMSFYGYSPLAGGLLAKPIEQITAPAPDTRFAQMPVFASLFCKPETLAGLRTFTTACEAHSIPVHEATLRWLKNHAPLNADDGIIIGASSEQQLQASLTAVEKGALPPSLLDAFETLWTEVAPYDVMAAEIEKAKKKGGS